MRDNKQRPVNELPDVLLLLLFMVFWLVQRDVAVVLGATILQEASTQTQSTTKRIHAVVFFI